MQPPSPPTGGQEAATPSTGDIQKLLKHVKGAETYSAYSVTEQLFKQCSAAADYQIPGAGEEDFEMPKTIDGEDLGVGKGWWHKGEFSPSTTCTSHTTKMELC